MSRSFTQSRALLERAKNSLAGGVSSPFRAQAPVPLYFTGGQGARLTDVDGNEYIDYQLAWGPMILGYSHPRVCEAVARQAMGVHSYGSQHELEIAVAERVQRMVPCAERLAFTSSGSETVQLAQRLARAFTGRNLILKFEGHYHGWMDSALVSYKPAKEKTGPLEHPASVPGSRGQVPNASENVIVAPWNRLDLLERMLDEHKDQVAGIFMEAVLCNSGCLMPESGYLEGVRELCNRHGAVLVFDEVITGFRIGPGGAQKHYGVTPDLATFGKAIGGGVALSAVGGRLDLMEQMFRSGVVFGGTFNGNPLSLAGANATLEELERDNGAALRHANAMGDRLKAGFAESARRHGIPLVVTGFGAAFFLHFTKLENLRDYRDTFDDDTPFLKKVLYRLVEEGVNLVPDGRAYVSAAHTEQDVAETLAAFDRVMASLAA